MSHRQLSVDVASTPLRNLSDNDDQAIAICFLGEAVTLAFREQPLGSITCAVARAPGGATATFTAGAITPDAIGLHEITAQNGSAPARRCRVVVFPVAAKTDPRIKEPKRQVFAERTVADPSPRTETIVREMLLRYVAEQKRTGQDLTALDALSTGSPLPASIDWRRHAPDGA